MLRLYPWIDTTGESAVYPVGDAVDVYKAALDLLYKDGVARPSIIVMHDTAEPGGDRPCPIAACNRAWPHKSKMDTSTILGFARMSPKRPGIRNFGYDIPVAFVSYKDRERLRADGIEYMAEHKIYNNLPGAEERYGLAIKFPGAWGVTELTKVGFNTRHTEALVQIRHWCGETCGSTETLFLKRIAGRWRVIERIPHYAEAQARGGMRYRGPAGESPAQSEIVADENGNGPSRSEPRDAAAVYRVALDSLYNFYGESPPRIIVTDRFVTNYGDTTRPKTPLESGLLEKYRFLSAIRSLPERPFTYRVPVKLVPEDAYPGLEKIGAPIAQKVGMNMPLWYGLMDEYPGIWGMVGLSRVAFNLRHTQALVYSNHQCGEGCGNADTWVLKRTGETWRIVERLSRVRDNHWDPLLFPLRYVGPDAKREAYRHRTLSALLINAVTGQPLSSLPLTSYGQPLANRVYATNSAGRVDFGTIPFFGILGMHARCPDQTSPDSLDAMEIIFSPGRDTTVVSRLDFRRCFHRSGPPPVTGAQASIGANEATFIFPFSSPAESWDLTIRRSVPGTTDYFWIIGWRNPAAGRDDPVNLWLSANQPPEGKPIRSLAELISKSRLEVMVECHSCDQPAVFPDQSFDTTKVRAHIDGGRLVFTVRGREAINEIFPHIPRVVTFRTTVRHKPNGKSELADIDRVQTVLVHCRISDSTGATRRRCNAPTNARLAPDAVDSTAPRRVKVVAIAYDGASLARNRDVRIKSEDLKLPPVIKSTGSSGAFRVLRPSRDSLTFEALCPARSNGPSDVSGEVALYLAAGRDTTVQVIVDERRCSGTKANR